MNDRGVVVDDDDRDAFFDEPTGQLGPPKPLAPAVLAVDISASKFAAGLVTTKGELADRSIALVDPDVGPEAHFRRLTTIVEQQMELADRHELRVAAVGIGCAGPIGPNCETVSPVGIRRGVSSRCASVSASSRRCACTAISTARRWPWPRGGRAPPRAWRTTA